MNAGPSERRNAARRELSLETRSPAVTVGSRSRPRVLWIDDEPDLMRAFVAFLTTEGCRVDLVETSAIGLALARTRSHDVILLDLAMPGMSGMQLLEVLKQEHIHTPVIIVTGCGTTIAGFDAARLGAVNLLEKPFRGAALLAAVRSLVRGSHAGRTIEPVRGLASADEGIFSGPADARVAKAIVRIAESPCDIPTVAAWAELAGPAEHTLRNWCSAAGVSPMGAVRLGRLLRAAVRLERLGRPFSDSLEIVDPRTFSHFVQLAGGTERSDSLPRTVDAFLRQQRVLSHPNVLHLVRDFVVRRLRDLTSVR